MSRSRPPSSPLIPRLRRMRAITTYAFPPIKDADFEAIVEALDRAPSSIADTAPVAQAQSVDEDARKPGQAHDHGALAVADSGQDA